MCASAAAPGRGTEKGGYRGHLMGCPVSVVRRERRISQPWLKTVAEISRLRSRGITYRHLRKMPIPCLTESRLAENRCALEQQFFEQQFSQATDLVHPARYPGFREVRRSALLPFSARATFHPDCTVGTGFSPVRPLLRAGFSSGVLRPVRIRRFVRFLPACESGSRAVTAGSEFHRPRSTMSILIMPQRTPGV